MTRLATGPAGRRRGGFSLLEVLAVVLLTSLVIGVALNHYVNLSSATGRAGERTRDVRRAIAILDRVASDFQGAVFVRPREGEDPYNNRYVFFGEPRKSQIGSDDLKLVTRSRRLRSDRGHESDLEVVSYALRETEEGDLQLLRSSQPRLPADGHDLSIPRDESEGAQLLAEGLEEFGVRFIDGAGGENGQWDAGNLVEAQELPVAVDIELALFDPQAELGAEPRLYRRRVLLATRALDLEELFDPASAVSGGSAEGDGSDERGADEESAAGGPEDERCLASPCANMTACQVMGCESRLGQSTVSIDELIRAEMQLNRSFCSFKRSLGISRDLIRLLVPNPACR